MFCFGKLKEEQRHEVKKDQLRFVGLLASLAVDKGKLWREFARD